METPLDVLSRAASLVHADDEKKHSPSERRPGPQPGTSLREDVFDGLEEDFSGLHGSWTDSIRLEPDDGPQQEVRPVGRKEEQPRQLAQQGRPAATSTGGGREITGQRSSGLQATFSGPSSVRTTESTSAGEAALRSEPRMQPLPISSSLTNHRTGPPPISPSKRKYSMDQGDDEVDSENDHVSKMSRMFSPHLSKTINGDYRKDHRDRSRSPIERAAAPNMSLHGNHLYASIPTLTMDQPLALTKNSLDGSRTVGIAPTLSPVDRQQNRPSVITCAPASNRNCNFSHCPVAHSGCVSAMPTNFRRTSNNTTACDPVVEEHFRRSLGKNYKEPEPVANSVSITGSVDDHFAKALGDTWLQIKAAKDGVSSSPESASRRGQSPPSSHMLNHNHSPSVLS